MSPNIIKKQITILIFLIIINSGCSPKEVHIDAESQERVQPNVNLLTVKTVLSGDMIELEDGRVIKYINIEAPKPGDALFFEAKKANETLITKGKNKVFLEFGSKKQDEKGNYLAYVYSPTPIFYYCFVNKELVEWGWAKVSVSPPNTKYVESFLYSENNAKEKKINIWK